ncbi:MAG: hypothetical protein GC191_10280 [Azospirillum sp.]|nr:hypothetical protein [Azospirillum sp.]
MGIGSRLTGLSAALAVVGWVSLSPGAAYAQAPAEPAAGTAQTAPQPPPQPAAPAPAIPTGPGPGYIPLGPGWVKPTDQWVDPSTAFFACFTGGSLAALTVSFYPMPGWALYAGALPAMGAVILRGGLGCYAALVAAGAYSATKSLMDRTGQTLHSLF